MLQRISLEQAAHIVTIEDPIEFIFKDQRSTINQREIGIDAESFPSALRAALRQNPDIIFVGELRDRETTETAIMAAETGHLVFSTMHTTGAVESLGRLLSYFPPHQHSQLRQSLASSLIACVAQRLVPRLDGKALIAAHEVLMNNATVRELIRKADDFSVLHDVIAQGGETYGMQSFDESLMGLYANGLITRDQALAHASGKDNLKLKIRGCRDVRTTPAIAWTAAAALMSVAGGCKSPPVNSLVANNYGAAATLTFVVGEFVPPAGLPGWSTLSLIMQPPTGTAVSKELTAANFLSQSQNTASFPLTPNTYRFSLVFAGAAAQAVYRQCAAPYALNYAVTATFAARIPICSMTSSVPVGQLDMLATGAVAAATAAAAVTTATAAAAAPGGQASSGAATNTVGAKASSVVNTLASIGNIFASMFSGSSSSAAGGSAGSAATGGATPAVAPSGGAVSSPATGGAGVASGSSNVGNLADPNSVAAYVGTGNCSPANYGLPSGAAPGTITSYAPSGSLSQLPSLSASAGNSDLKAFVATVYQTFPVFSQVYQAELGLTEPQALAFMFADMSRESAGGSGWQINLETGQGSSGQAWGPFQAAVTNFTGGGYDSSIEDGTGLPIPNMAQFQDPATSTYAGMKRLADGILNAMKVFGTGQPAQAYLLGTLADHNTGWPQSSTQSSWLNSYGYPVLTMMQAYLAQTGNLTNNYVIGNGQSCN